MVILHKSQQNLQFRNFIFVASAAADAAHYVGRIYVWLALATAACVPADPLVDDASHTDEAENQYWIRAIQGETNRRRTRGL